MKTRVFYRSCVNWPEQDVHAPGGLVDMIDAATGITRRTFCRNVDRRTREAVEVELGYELRGKRGLTMARDFHVSYHRSVLHGQVVYFFRHSAIEYVFK